ncbi:MAG TPA: PAS domain S-box protein, partial [Thermoanaerobaculia bacterium]|nr:PAS domain S-box protein [Thermoanaerobaculia bacterium]
MSESETPSSRDWLRVSLDSIQDAVIAADAAGHVTFMNPAAERLTGESADSARSRPLGDVLELLEETTRRPVEIPVQGGAAAAGTVARRPLLDVANGRERLIEVTVDPLRDEAGNPAGVVLVLSDVTGRLRAERSLRESQERYRALIEQSSEGIWRFELEQPVAIDLPEDEQVDLFFRHGVLAECNRTMAHMYGFEDETEILGARLGQLLPASDPHNVDYLRSFVRSGYRLTGAESHETDAEGSPKFFLNNLLGVVEEGRLTRVWGTQLDVTDQKKLEDELRKRAEELIGADRRKDQFLAMLAHELRNPLAPIRNAVELMRQVETVDPTFQPSREMVERQVKHLARLVDDLLDVSRITQGSIRLRKEVIDL